MATASAAVKKKKKKPVRIEFASIMKKAFKMATTKGKSFDPEYVQGLQDLAEKKIKGEWLKEKPVLKIIKHPVLDRRAITQTDNLIKNYLEPAARKKKKLMLENWVKKGV